MVLLDKLVDADVPPRSMNSDVLAHDVSRCFGNHFIRCFHSLYTPNRAKPWAIEGGARLPA